MSGAVWSAVAGCAASSAPQILPSLAWLPPLPPLMLHRPRRRSNALKHAVTTPRKRKKMCASIFLFRESSYTMFSMSRLPPPRPCTRVFYMPIRWGGGAGGQRGTQSWGERSVWGNESTRKTGRQEGCGQGGKEQGKSKSAGEPNHSERARSRAQDQNGERSQGELA